MKKISIIFISLVFLTTGIGSATADDTYAMLDNNGVVTNIIVCGLDCAGGSFAGQTVVKQVAQDPVTGENRGGVWQGPNTTTYSIDGTFTMQYNNPVSKTIVDIQQNFDENNNLIENKTVSTASINFTEVSFKYEDTKEEKLEWSKILKGVLKQNTSATINVSDDKDSESVNYNERKTEQEIVNDINVKNLKLMISKINNILKLLNTWILK